MYREKRKEGFEVRKFPKDKKIYRSKSDSNDSFKSRNSESSKRFSKSSNSEQRSGSFSSKEQNFRDSKSNNVGRYFSRGRNIGSSSNPDSKYSTDRSQDNSRSRGSSYRTRSRAWGFNRSRTNARGGRGGNRFGKYIDPQKFIFKDVKIAEDKKDAYEGKSFVGYKLDKRLVNSIMSKGFVKTTQIQEMVISQVID